MPEPPTLALLGAAAAGMLGCAWRRRRRHADKTKTTRRRAVLATSSIIAVVALYSGLCGQAGADTLQFSDSFNLYGNWQNYLYSASNAQVYTEQVAGNSTYWRPTTTGLAGTVEYAVSAIVPSDIGNADGRNRRFHIRG